MSTAPAIQNPDTTPAKPVRDPKITNEVLKQVEALQSKGQLVLPEDYNVANALHFAWLKLNTTENKDKKPIMKNGQVDESVVTKLSVANALLDYVTQGLNCSKDQAYFLVYGNALTLQRSYFGDVLVATRSKPGIKFDWETIREGERVGIIRTMTPKGMITSVSHDQITFPRNPKITGAYCGVFDEDGVCLGYDVMDIDRIKQSWMKSPTYKWSKPDKPSTHDEFPEEMCIRTVVRHRCKPIFKTSGDPVLRESLRRSDELAIEAELDEEVAELGNGQVIKVEALPEGKEQLVIPTNGQAQEAVLVEAESVQEQPKRRPGF